MMARVYDRTGHNALGLRQRIDGQSEVNVTRYDADGHMVPEGCYSITMDRREVLDHLDVLESAGYRIERY